MSTVKDEEWPSNIGLTDGKMDTEGELSLKPQQKQKESIHFPYPHPWSLPSEL